MLYLRIVALRTEFFLASNRGLVQMCAMYKYVLYLDFVLNL
jgi:hypothetical protein